MSNNIEFLPYPEILAKTEPSKLVVFLHGVGSDGNDLIALTPFFEEHIDGAHFISPHGVEHYDMAPFGRQWFSLIDRTPATIIRLARENAVHLKTFIEAKQEELGLGNEDTIIIGFSQGTMMGLYLTLSEARPYAACIAFSGRLIPPVRLENSLTPICLIHGKDDNIVPPEESDATAEYLAKAGIKYEKLIVDNLAHSIDASGIKFACDFLNKYVKKMEV